MNWKELIDVLLSDDVDALTRLEEDVTRLYSLIHFTDEDNEDELPNLYAVVGELGYFIRRRISTLKQQQG